MMSRMSRLGRTVESTDRYEMCSEQKISVPVLVVCFTNHALDQFLEGILKFCPKQGKPAIVQWGASRHNGIMKCVICIYVKANADKYNNFPRSAM